MDKETYEKQKPFAGVKKPSMQRRCVGHDYQERQIYMITMVTEGRKPLLGQLTGRSDGQVGSHDEPRVLLSALGQRVEQCWNEITVRYPQITILAFQMMPDHFHGILFVKEHLDRSLGKVLLGFKQGCNKAFRELVPSVAILQQQTRQRPDGKDDRLHGMLFARGYNDKLLIQAGQLQRWYDYIADNPRRLLMKRERPDLFRVQRELMVAGMSFSAIGNRFLLKRPLLRQVQCSRRLRDDEIEAYIKCCLSDAEKGAVLVSPSISPGEKAVMRAAFDRGYPLILLQENGFTDLAKPGGKRMEYCSEGRLLILAPWEHHNERLLIRRDQCLSLNEMARRICSVCCCTTATNNGTTATDNDGQ